MLKSYCQKQKLKCRSEKKAPLSISGEGFTLAEVAAAIIIMAFICSGVLVFINRSMDSAADVTIQMQAFEIARENMEKLLATDSVKEYTDFGYSEEHPQIQWQTTVESFYEPVTDRLWIQAICAAEYTDSKGEQKKVELTHWLTDLTKKQILELLEEKEKQQEYLELINQLLNTIEEAAEYAGVDEETIEQWADNGMPVTEDGYFIKIYLDLYKNTNGNPSAEEIEKVEKIFDDELTGTGFPGYTSGPYEGDKGTVPGPKGPEIKPEQIPRVNCDPLPFCDRIRCLIDSGQENRIPFSEAWEYVQECFN